MNRRLRFSLEYFSTLILTLVILISISSVLMLSTYSIHRAYGTLPEFIVIGRIVDKDFSKNSIVVQCEYIYNWSGRWDGFSEVLNGSAPNIDALMDLDVGDYVMGVAYGTLPNKNGWYKGWISIAKLSKNLELVTDIYGDIYDVKPFLGGFRIEYLSVPVDSDECLCLVKYIVLSLYDSDSNLLLNKSMFPGEDLKYVHGCESSEYINAYSIYLKFYNGTYQKCFGLQGHCIFTIHFQEIAVKFKGTIVDASSQYDLIVRIDEILLDPEKKLSSGDYAHIDIAGSISKCDVDWPLNAGDSVEVYAKHFAYGEWSYENWNISISVWIYSKDSQYDGYLKKTGGLKAEIWTDRGCGSVYYIGDPIIIYFKVSLKAYIRIIDEFPNGSRKQLCEGWAQPNITYYISGRIGFPSGYRIFHLYAKDEGGSTAYSQCFISVLKKSKPDLAIKNVSYNPSQPVEGDSVKVRLTITNIGTQPASNFNIIMEVDGKKVTEEKIGLLNPKEVKYVEFTWKAEEGTHEIRFIVDKDNRIDENNEQNNFKVIYIVVKSKKIDLVLRSVSFNPSQPLKGEAVKFDVSVENIGEKESSSFYVLLKVDGEKIDEKQIQSLSPGEVKHISFTWTSEGGWHVVEIIADSRNSVDELDEDNNIYMLRIGVKYLSNVDIEKFRLIAKEAATYLKSLRDYLSEKSDPQKYLDEFITKTKKFGEELVSIKKFPKSVLVNIFKSGDIEDVGSICESILFSFNMLSEAAFWSNFWTNEELETYTYDLVEHISILADAFEKEAEFWASTDGTDIDFNKLAEILNYEKYAILKLIKASKRDLDGILKYFEEKPYKPVVISEEVLYEGVEKIYYFELRRDPKYVDIKIEQEYYPNWWEVLLSRPSYRLELWWYNPDPDPYSISDKPEWQKVWSSDGMELKIGSEYKMLLAQLGIPKPSRFKLKIYPKDFGGDFNFLFWHSEGPKTQKVKITLRYGPEEKRYIDIYSTQAKALESFKENFLNFLNKWLNITENKIKTVSIIRE